MDLSVGRLLTLLELLQAHRRLSATEIASRLEVDRRTVRRYIAGLQEMGIPVEGERGRAGGYRLRPGFKLPPLMFTDEEGVALVLGLLAVQRLGLVRDGQALNGAMAKLDRVLPDGLRKRLKAMQEMLGLGLSPVARGSADAQTVLTISSAALDGNRVKLAYEAAQGARTVRVVDPYGIAFQSGNWYLVANDHLRNDLRTFRLDRIRSADVLRETFDRPVGFDVVAHVQRSIALIPYGLTAEILLHVSPAEARKRIPPALGTLEPAENGVLLRLGAEELEWIARFLAGLPWDFTVVSPPELRKALVDAAGRLAANARR
jgi:predicted DNA-binding transcriptional regulator YafY